MDLKSVLDRIIESKNLLDNPFYRAWSAGELSLSALRTYAEEYGAFIALLPDGWLAQNDPENAQEEQEHLQLWGDFARALDTQVGGLTLPETRGLVATAKSLFTESPTAIGALYAFEVQQPSTAKTKLDGLKAFYKLPKPAYAYFVAHQQNEDEAEKLFDRMSELESREQALAVQACARMSSALWDALTAIYEKGE